MIPSSPCNERPVWIACEGETLLGVVNPADGQARFGVLVVVGGRQYRAGSARFFVHAARAFADAGVPSLRFDIRGMGDSSGAIRSFEQTQPDIDAAISALMAEVPSLQGVVLWGLCDAASAALLYLSATQDDRVTGLMLLNPWVRSQQTLARTRLRHHYRNRVRDPRFWTRLVQGDVHVNSLFSWWQDWRAARTEQRSARSFRTSMADAWHGSARPTSVLLSATDDTALEFYETATTLAEWKGSLDKPNVTVDWVLGSDHTFSSPAHRQQVVAATIALIRGLESAPAGANVGRSGTAA